MKYRKKKFTLIELLVVIAIIAILMSLLLPMVNNIRNRAIKTKAKAEMSSIITAVKSYEMTYGVLPVPGTNYSESAPLETANYDNLITFLTNVPTGSATEGNGRGIRFLDIPNDVNYASVGFQDPWGKDFSVLLDTDYDGEITAGPTTPVAGDTLYGSIFVYTWVGDGVQTDTDYVYSWK